MNQPDFSDIAIVACGTLAPELNRLKKEGFLNAGQIIFTTPGLHQDCVELERQLLKAIKRARERFAKVLVVYGGKFCYVNTAEPTRTMQKIIAEQGEGVARINATHCMDMLASESFRNETAGGEPVWWMTPGWVRFKDDVFKGWDKAMANENFPRHTGGATVLDGLGYFDKLLNEDPEKVLEMSDWMGIPMQACPITLDRLKDLLADQVKELNK
ncbi:DUF1638 domain-containing protein [Dethiosulfatarculus sandiegensis]|uniref:DUF1638 domain-containing protein n=1 Tax=Dethiosulfatarculus sandiegensis TaxID=1429043 RepID=A0A0D2IXR9_9BACT|nr:DUF1638 domain-containing protein [Dethiosulfatarculus sandiegensis]KIX10844.1 hypothetical protein X474_26625 [Dethiosulfatarculus sandiegensis]